MKNPLAGVLASDRAAESSRLRIAGSTSARVAYVGAVTLYVFSGTRWYDWMASPSASAFIVYASAFRPLRVPTSNDPARRSAPASSSSAVRTVRYSELKTLSAMPVFGGTRPCSASLMEMSAALVDASSSVTRPAM